MKTVLISTLGASPQVVTETLWALMNPELTETKRPPDERRVPFRVHMIATAFIAEREDEIRERIVELYRQGGHPPPGGDDVLLDVVEDDSGAPIPDIRTARDNAFFSRRIADTVRGYAGDESLRIHLSLAGGRKTMSSYALSAAMFFCRPHDEVSHVLANPPELEGHPEFWWPGQPVGEVARRARGGGPETRVSTAIGSASVDLVPVPFAPLSPLLPAGASEKAADLESIARWIRSYQSYRQGGRLVLDFKALTLEIGEEPLARLTQKEFSLYALLALARKGDWRGAGPEGVGGEHRGWIASKDLDVHDGRPALALVEIWGAVLTKEDKRRAQERKEDKHDKSLNKGEFIADLRSPDLRAYRPLASGLSKLWGALKLKIKNPYLIGDVHPVHVKKGPRDQYRLGLVSPRDRIEIRNAPPEVRAFLTD